MLHMNLGENYFSFVLKDIKKIKELDIVAYFFVHEKLKTEVLFLKNKDKEKAFCISFKTPSFDDSGINHVLEHSVLNGSSKYPIKNLISELSKNTIATYINASTYPDKTIYPASSIYNSEFKKLFSVYVDAVFSPNVVSDKNIFLQEGVRLELDKGGRLKYNGVVFNEMKGSLSGPDRLFWTFMSKHLFSYNFYKYESGGDPKKIINLSHKKLVDHYKKYYHPSNSLFFFYGDLDILYYLKFLEENYFKNYKYKKIDSVVSFPKNFKKAKQKVEEFFIPKNQSIKNKSYLSMSFKMMSSENRLEMLAVAILSRILIGESSRPLKKALLDKSFCEDIEYDFEMGLICGVFSILCKNTSQKYKDLFEKTVFLELKRLVLNGIDKELIFSVLDSVEFYLESRLLQTKRGVALASESLETWLYGFGYDKALEFRSDFEKIRELARGDYFESLIERYFLKNKNRLFLTMKASRKKDTEKYLNKKLKESQKSFRKNKINKIKKENDEFKSYQNQKEQSGASFALRPLSVSDIPKKHVFGRLDFKKVSGVEYLFYKSKSKSISSLNIFFDLSYFSLRDLQYLRFMSDLFLELSFKNSTNYDFQNKIERYFGSVYFSVNILEGKDSDILAKLSLSCSFLNKNTSDAARVLNDIFNNLNFDEGSIKRVINESLSQVESSFVGSAYRHAILLSGSAVSSRVFYEEAIFGYSYFSFLKELKNDFSDNPKKIVKKLKNLYFVVFSKNNVVVNFCSQKDSFLIDSLGLISKNKRGKSQKIKKRFSKNKKTALIVASGVQYNSLSLKFHPKKYHGYMSVFMLMLYYDYLWKDIREKGGAYDIISSLGRSGHFSLCSYRDPRLKDTFFDFYKIISSLKEDKIRQNDIEKYIVKAVSFIDAPKTDYEESLALSFDYMCSYSEKDKERVREQILSCKIEDLKEFALFLELSLKKSSIASVGNEGIINKNSDFFKKIISLD